MRTESENSCFFKHSNKFVEQNQHPKDQRPQTSTIKTNQQSCSIDIHERTDPSVICQCFKYSKISSHFYKITKELYLLDQPLSLEASQLSALASRAIASIVWRDRLCYQHSIQDTWLVVVVLIF